MRARISERVGAAWVTILLTILLLQPVLANAIEFPFVDAPGYFQSVLFDYLHDPFETSIEADNSGQIQAGVPVLIDTTSNGDPICARSLLFAANSHGRSAVVATLYVGAIVIVALADDGAISGVASDGQTIFLSRLKVVSIDPVNGKQLWRTAIISLSLPAKCLS